VKGISEGKRPLLGGNGFLVELLLEHVMAQVGGNSYLLHGAARPAYAQIGRHVQVQRQRRCAAALRQGVALDDRLRQLSQPA
jgi:hypothetical protein